MELAIKNKFVSVGESSTVQDMNGKDIFNVKGKVFSLTRIKTIFDMNGNTQYIVRNKFWSLFSRTALVYNATGDVVVTVKRKIFSVHDRYMIESSLGELEIIGNILGFDYKIILNGQEIGHISRKLNFVDSFILTIPDNVDYALYVALVIAIDNITDRRNSARDID